MHIQMVPVVFAPLAHLEHARVPTPLLHCLDHPVKLNQRRRSVLRVALVAALLSCHWRLNSSIDISKQLYIVESKTALGIQLSRRPVTHLRHRRFFRVPKFKAQSIEVNLISFRWYNCHFLRRTMAFTHAQICFVVLDRLEL